MTSLRDSGINAIGDIPLNTHMSYLYSTREEAGRVLISYLKAGLDNNEMCLWIHSSNCQTDEAMSLLKSSIENIDFYLERNQLKVVPYNQWYLTDGVLVSEKVNQKWIEMVKRCKELGFEGLRAAGGTAWLKKYNRHFGAYEYKLNEIIYENPMIVLCFYEAGQVRVPEVADIVNNHGYTIISDTLDNNTDNAEIKVVRNAELITKEKLLVESRKLLNELINRNKAKSEFISSVSHELRTPLNVILSTIQLLDHMRSQSEDIAPPVNERIKKYLRIIQQNCYRQLRLVNNLIDISRMDLDFYELHLQNCNIVEVVENITDSVAEYIKQKGLSVEFDTNKEEIIIACDPDQMERIVLNLLSNAVKFTRPGGKIWVNVFGEENAVKISVKDTGVGIPQDKLDIIFEKFQQVSNPMIRSYEGSGIGLSLVKFLVEKHNGKITVKSKQGYGSEFIIELPVTTIEVNPRAYCEQIDVGRPSPIERINIEFSDVCS